MIEACLVLDDLWTRIALTSIQSQYWDTIPWFLRLCYVTLPGKMGINLCSPHLGHQKEGKETIPLHLAWWTQTHWGDLEAYKCHKGGSVTEKARLSVGGAPRKPPPGAFSHPRPLVTFIILGRGLMAPASFSVSRTLSIISFRRSYISSAFSLLREKAVTNVFMLRKQLVAKLSSKSPRRLNCPSVKLGRWDL